MYAIQRFHWISYKILSIFLDLMVLLKEPWMFFCKKEVLMYETSVDSYLRIHLKIELKTLLCPKYQISAYSNKEGKVGF